MSGNVIARYVGGRAYAVKVPQSIAEKHGISEGKEIPRPVLLHLLFTGRIEVYTDKGERLTFEDVVKDTADPDSFSLFIVFHDLAKRGKKVAVADGHRGLVLLDDGVMIYVLDEDHYITAGELYDLVDKAIKQEYRLVIAVVDVNGEITYYEVSKMDFPKIVRR
uniref:Uncharacterized protein n=1 Tax=Ignisphaera aggregans TaxID=334771 RepID=A0A7C2VH43_9CREN